MNIVFFGTPELAIPTLQALCNNPKHSVIAVGVMPPKPQNRGMDTIKTPVHKCAESRNIPTYECPKKKDVSALLERLKPDIAIVIAYGVIFNNDSFSSCKHGIINVHYSLLPLYRGASPVQSAILDGQTVSGITVQQMKLELDAGDIWGQKPLNMHNYTTGEIWKQWSYETIDCVLETLDMINSGQKPYPQDDTKATYCTLFTKNDGLINTKTMSANDIYKRYRAYNPWPQIYFIDDYGHTILKKIRVYDGSIDAKEGLLPCADGTYIVIESVQIAGKKPMNGNEYMSYRGNNTTL